MSDVCLVNMPFVALERPSLAIGLLQADARESGLSVRSEHPALPFAEAVGIEIYCRLLHAAPDENLCDWLFAGAAFPGERARHEAFLERLDVQRIADWLWLRPNQLRDALWSVREQADRLVSRSAHEIVSSGARVVGCSSVFQQQVASLALLRAVKELDPSVVTMLGGANCESEMGSAIHRSFTWVDYVVSGEADRIFGALCRRALDDPGATRSDPFPAGVLGPGHRRADGASRPEALPRSRVDDLDRLPVPDYSDYFAALSRSPLRKDIHPALLAESSRGCWWGEKHHCTFCGLNGSEMAYRPKSSERVLAEFAQLVETYGTHRILVVDNILHRGHLDTVIPALAEAGAPYSLFYETKANLTRAQIERLADAGVRRVQPGFESLSLGALELFDKGTTPVTNLQYLRTARWLGTFVTWNFLWHVPGEEWSWYTDIADWIPLVTHLQPPNTLCAVRFDRFSVYHARPEDFGLRLRPTPGLAFIYPVDDVTLHDLAYYFIDVGRPVEAALRRRDRGLRHFEAEIDRWMTLWDRVRRADAAAPLVPRLEMRTTPGGVEITDTRPCAPEPDVVLTGLDAQVLLICDDAPTRAGLRHRLRESEARVGTAPVDEAVERLRRRRLLLALDGRLVALPTRVQRRPYIPVEEYPGGYLLPEQRSHNPRLRS